MKEQSVGAGNGIQGQRKKISTTQTGGRFEAYDRLRPAEIITLDLLYDIEHFERLLLGDVVWAPGDVASDADNVWSDPAVVDAHTYAGFTYDYFATRQDWHGVDGRNGRMFNMVNIAQGFTAAFYAPPPVGPEAAGVAIFGEDENGAPLVAVDIVAHELMHGVTDHSLFQRTGLPLLETSSSILGPSSFTERDEVHECGGRIYTWADPIREEWQGREFQFLCEENRYLLIANEGGAVHEAWSDIFSTAVEFSVHEPPHRDIGCPPLAGGGGFPLLAPGRFACSISGKPALHQRTWGSSVRWRRIALPAAEPSAVLSCYSCFDKNRTAIA